MAMAGRKIKLYSGTGVSRALVAGGRSETITINGEAIDVTVKDSNGWRTLIADPAVRSVDVAAEMVFDTAALVTIALATDTSDMLSDYEIDVEGVGIIAGTFHLSGVEIGAPHDAEATQNITLASSGPITFTADT